VETSSLFTICFKGNKPVIGSSVPSKVNFGVVWRWIPKSFVTAHVEIPKELSRVGWSHLCALANDSLASYSP
jgi:hypothetical protein